MVSQSRLESMSTLNSLNGVSSYQSLQRIILLLLVSDSTSGFQRLPHLEVQEHLLVATRHQKLAGVRTEPKIMPLVEPNFS